MALWLAIVLPALPLQLATRALEPVADALPPVAIIEGPAQRPRIAYCNDAAHAAGVLPGQKLAAAQALARDLIALERHVEREHDALFELACWAYQYSAAVVPQGAPQADGTLPPASGVLLEIGGSLRLFGGRERLTRQITQGLKALGYVARLGVAPTPRGAWWLAVARARGHDGSAVLSLEELPAALNPLPLAVTGWNDDTLATLHALGLHTVGDVQRLPRDAARKRFDATLLVDLDRAFGRVPDPQPPFEPPERFAATLELPADLTEAELLLRPAARLLASLEGFLRGRDAGATELIFRAHHNPRRMQPTPPTEILLTLAAPERDAQRLGKLLTERLMRAQLPEPAIALALTVEHLHPFAAHNASLLPPAPGDHDHGLDWLKLAETLHARLGSERVFQWRIDDDHRPEYAAQKVPVAIEPPRRAAAAPEVAAPRPLLLLDAPQPLPMHDDAPAYAGPLTLLAGPERIESGWWDHGSAHRRAVFRDYFVARNPRGQTVWIFQELAAPRRWYLHGFFS